MRAFKVILRWVFALFFAGAGVMHFRSPRFYERMMPSYLPWHKPLVLVSGVCEIFLGVLLVIPRFTRAAAMGVIALLLAVFPANVEMARHPERFRMFSPRALLIRLPLQLVLIAIAWFVGGLGSRKSRSVTSER